MTWHLFLDESGDLGFDFEEKKPSRFLTISVLAVSQQQVVKGLRSAVAKTLRRKVNRKKTKRPGEELKGSATSIEIKRHFYEQVAHEKFGIYAFSLNKKRVDEELKRHSTTKHSLYNFVAKQVLSKIPLERANGAVELIVDKSKGKREIADFNQSLQNQLKERLGSHASIVIHHRNSKEDRGLSAADLFCWGVFRKWERDDLEWFNLFRDKVLLDERYL